MKVLLGNDAYCLFLVLPQVQRSREVLLFWDACVADSSSPFLCDADSFFTTLRKSFTHKVKAKQPGQVEKGAACRCRLSYRPWNLVSDCFCGCCSVFSAVEGAPGGVRRPAPPQARLPPRQGHALPAVGVSEALEHPGPGSTHHPALQRRSGLSHTTGSHGNRPHRVLIPINLAAGGVCTS